MSEAQVGAAADALLDEAVPVDTKTAFLRALAHRGEFPEEIAGFVTAFMGRAVRPSLEARALDRPAIDVCGTGGDHLGLFNVSTTAMLIVAGSGAAVLKHGNRGVTSPSGSADVLEQLGIRIDLPPDRLAECVKRTGLGFMLAPAYHPAFRAVVPVRKALAAEGTRTIFNIIGPLLNPAQPPFQLAGVFSAGLAETYARTFLRLGRTRAWAVHGHTSDGRGMDEVSLFGSTLAAKAADGVVAVEMIGPPERIPAPDSINQLAGGSPAVNAEILEGIVRGEVHGPKRDLSVVNAAAALVVAGLAPGLDDGCEEAEAAIDSGRAARALDAWRAFAD